MAEQPLATDQSAQSSISELKKISAALGADQKVTEKLASDTKDTKEGTEKIATSATTFTKILGDMKGLQETAMALAERARKAALRMASKIDPSKYMKAMADKTKKFAGDLLSLLLKGGILMGLALLLKWLATQDWEKWWNEWGPKIKKKWEEFKTMFTDFYNDYKEIIDAISVISAMAAIWKAADWLKKATSPIVLLMGALLKIFAVGTGTIALLLAEVALWVGKKLFHITDGTLSKLWSKIKLLFGGAGTIFKMIAIVGEWLGKGFFTLTKGSLGLLWGAIVKLFGGAGTIFKMIAHVGGWLEKGFFTLTKGSLSLLWGAIVKLFGGAGTIFKLIAKVTEWLGKGFFTLTKGSLGLLWGAIKLIFGGTGTIATLLTDVGKWAKNTMFGEGGPMQKVWKLLTDIFGDKETGLIKKLVTFFGDIKNIKMFGDTGPFQKMWKAIKGFFGIGGTLAKSAGFLMTAEEMVDLKQIGLHKEGALRTMWAAIKGFFGPDGKIDKMLKVLNITPLPTWFDEGGHFRKAWTFIKNMFGAAGDGAGKIAKMVSAIVVTPLPDWFDEKGEFQKLWKFVKGVFGPTGAIKKAWDVVSGAADWFNDRHDLINLYRWMKGLFSAEGSIGKFFKSVGPAVDDATGTKPTSWFGKDSKIAKMFTWFKSLFGKDSAIGKFVTKLSGWGKTFKEWFPDKVKKGGTKAATGIMGFFNFMGDIIGSIGKFTKGILTHPIIKAMLKFFGFVGGKALGLLGTLGKFFAPIGWIMAIIEGMMGFWEGFKSKGKDDTRTMSEKMMDGLKGAMKALVDFFVIDMIEMVESMINWAIRKINDFIGDTVGLQWLKMDEVNFSGPIKDMLHGLIDKLIPKGDRDMTAGGEAWTKVAGVAALKNLKDMGMGSYSEKEGEFMFKGEKFRKMLETMSIKEMSRMAKKLSLVEGATGVQGVDGGNWHKIMKAEWERRKDLGKWDDSLQGAEYSAQRKALNNTTNIYGGDSALLMRIDPRPGPAILAINDLGVRGTF